MSSQADFFTTLLLLLLLDIVQENCNVYDPFLMDLFMDQLFPNRKYKLNFLGISILNKYIFWKTDIRYYTSIKL